MLTNYRRKKGKTLAVDSDHNTMILNLRINYKIKHEERKEIRSIRRKENIITFKEATSNDNVLSGCFKSYNSLISTAQH